MFSGVTANTSKHLQLDAGAFYKNYDVTTDTPSSAASKLIGATSGGGSFSAVPTVRRIEVDGVKGATKGFETIDEWVINLTANIKELTVDNLKMALTTGKSVSSTSPTNYTKITADNEIESNDYIDNVTWIGRISGSANPVIIVVKNVLATNGLTLTTADKSEGVVPVTLTGHYDPSNLDVVPFEIYYPSIA